MSGAHEIIDRQVAAYNRRDLEDFVACYAAGANVVRPDGKPLASGRDEIRAVYGQLFGRSPDARVEIRNRIEVGSVVIDEEYITGVAQPGMPAELHAAVAYRVADDLIQDAHILA